MPKRIIDCIENIPKFLIKAYKKKLKKNPGSRYFVPLSKVYRVNGKVQEAIDVCEKGMLSFPNYVSGRVMLGIAYFEACRFDEAESEFNKAKTTSRGNLLVHRMLYKVLLSKGKKELAIDELKNIIAINPDDNEAQALLKNLQKVFPVKGKKKTTPSVTVKKQPDPIVEHKPSVAVEKKIAPIIKKETISKWKFVEEKKETAVPNIQESITILEGWLKNIDEIRNIRNQRNAV